MTINKAFIIICFGLIGIAIVVGSIAPASPLHTPINPLTAEQTAAQHDAEACFERNQRLLDKADAEISNHCGFFVAPIGTKDTTMPCVALEQWRAAVVAEQQACSK